MFDHYHVFQELLWSFLRVILRRMIMSSLSKNDSKARNTCFPSHWSTTFTSKLRTRRKRNNLTKNIFSPLKSKLSFCHISLNKQCFEISGSFPLHKVFWFGLLMSFCSYLVWSWLIQHASCNYWVNFNRS